MYGVCQRNGNSIVMNYLDSSIIKSMRRVVPLGKNFLMLSLGRKNTSKIYCLESYKVQRDELRR